MGRLDTNSDWVRTVVAECANTDDAREAYGAAQRAIVDCERRGQSVPRELIMIRETAALECKAQSQGR
ncbi:MAG: hypothetical protein AAFR55_04230 [Pseudomonadota bacterium]